MQEVAAERLALYRDEVIDAGAEDEKPLEGVEDHASPSGNAFEPSCMRSNLQPSIFGLKVRTRGPQPSILVRTFSLFTRGAIDPVALFRRSLERHLSW